MYVIVYMYLFTLFIINVIVIICKAELIFMGHISHYKIAKTCSAQHSHVYMVSLISYIILKYILY